MKILAAGIILSVGASSAAMAQVNINPTDPQPTCNMCPGYVIPLAELEAYTSKAKAEGITDQQVRDIEIGKAHVGIGMVYRGKLDAPLPNAVAPSARHYAIEPLPHLHQSLLQQFPRQHIHCCALGEQAGTAVFRHVVNAPAYSGLQERPYDGIEAQIAELPVDVVRLDDLIPATELVALIKLDLEGGEYHALRGGITLIRRTQALIIFECGSGSSAAYGVDLEMIYTLVTSELGYSLSTLSKWLRGKKGFTLTQFRGACLSEFFFIAYPAAD